MSIDHYTYQGGVYKASTLEEAVLRDRSPHTRWIEQLLTGLDFASPDTSLAYIADVPFHQYIQKLKPILLQGLSVNESLPVAFSKDVGARRARPVVGSSAGGSISISRAVTRGTSVLRSLAQHGIKSGIDPAQWQEQNFVNLVGMNHDLFRTPIGIVIVEGTPDGKSISAKMMEQCLITSYATSYQSGQFLIMEGISMVYEQMVPIWGAKKGVDYATY